jgi:hypothetical protein
MSAKRDKSQGFAFVLSGKKHIQTDLLVHSDVYKQFVEKDSVPGMSDAEIAEELEIIAADVMRHLHDGVSAATVLTWLIDDSAKLNRKVSK